MVVTVRSLGLSGISGYEVSVESLDKSRLLDYKGEITSRKVMGQITKALQVQIGVFEENN